MKTNQTEWRSVKVPESLHTMLKWMSFQRKRHIYQIIAALIYKELEGDKK